MRKVAPKPLIGFIFSVRIYYTSKTGTDMIVAVQHRDAHHARELALAFPDAPKATSIKILRERDADIRDFPLPDAYVQQVGRTRPFGIHRKTNALTRTKRF